MTFKDPIQVTLSDSVIRVNASISNQASQRYVKEIKRPLTQGTLGMLIQLHDFEIVATHLGPRDKRLTLYVKEFKSLDTGESGNFGVAPQAIESREGTKELLNKLADLRKHGMHIQSAESAVESPMESQPSTQISEATNDQDSQAGFATQVPRSVAPIVNKSKPLGSITSVNISSTSSANSAKSSAHPMKVKHSNLSEGILSPLQRKTAPERPSISHKKALLGLLRNHNRAPRVQERKLDSPLGQSLEQVTVSSEPVTGEDEKQASQIENPIAHDIKDSRIAIATEKRKRQSPETSQRKKLSNEHSLQEITSAHNQMRNGISPRDVRIPKDQETLLSRADCK